MKYPKKIPMCTGFLEYHIPSINIKTSLIHEYYIEHGTYYFWGYYTSMHPLGCELKDWRVIQDTGVGVMETNIMESNKWNQIITTGLSEKQWIAGEGQSGTIIWLDVYKNYTGFF